MNELRFEDGFALTRSLRDRARNALPERAFLRRDRGDALFVSNAPMLGPTAVPDCFEADEKRGLLFLTPAPEVLIRFSQQRPDPPDFFCASLRRFEGLPVDPESRFLFALGLRWLDGDTTAARFDRLLRQRAAVCLREKHAGGGLYACGLVRYDLLEN